jgi:hypothetical protein
MQPQLQPPYTGAMMGFGRFNLLKGSRWGGSHQWRSKTAMSSTKGVVALATMASGHLDSGELGSVKGKGRSQAVNSFVTTASGHLDSGELP